MRARRTCRRVRSARQCRFWSRRLPQPGRQHCCKGGSLKGYRRCSILPDRWHPTPPCSWTCANTLQRLNQWCYGGDNIKCNLSLRYLPHIAANKICEAKHIYNAKKLRISYLFESNAIVVGEGFGTSHSKPTAKAVPAGLIKLLFIFR